MGKRGLHSWLPMCNAVLRMPVKNWTISGKLIGRQTTDEQWENIGCLSEPCS
jgi:hypothetical protein